MSFAVWMSRPPFECSKEDREQAYQVGDKWVVTDDPSRATQQEIDAVLNAPPAVARSLDDKLGTLGVTVAELKAALT